MGHLPRLTLALVLALAACEGDPAVTADVAGDDGLVADIAADTALTEDTSGASDVALDTVPEETDVPTDGATPSDTALEDTGTDTVAVDDTAGVEDTATADTEPPGDACCDATDATPDATSDPYAGLDSTALRAQLRAETTAGHTPLGYNGARDEMYAVGGIDDVGGRIECVYTGRTVDANGSRTPDKNCRLADGTQVSCRLNTEHTFARYYLDLALTEGSAAYNAAESDIHHIFPSEEGVNTARWHFDFGETTCLADGDCKVNEGSQVGQRPGVTGYSNCPTGNVALGHVCLMRVRPARQGDVARGMLYMAVRYGMSLDDAMESALRAWNLADPPDDRERARNDAIEAVQGNRNPFVDRPDLVDRIVDY